MECVWRNKGNARVCECIIMSCAVSRFCRNRNIFMAVIWDLAKRRQADCRCFIESVHEWIKTDLMTNKAASSYISILFIVCCFLVTAPNKKKMCYVSHVTDGVFSECITISQQKLKNFLGTWPHFPLSLLLGWWYENTKWSTVSSLCLILAYRSSALCLALPYR